MDGLGKEVLLVSFEGGVYCKEGAGRAGRCGIR